MHINVRFIFCAGGIFFFFFVFGVLQEKIFKSKYGENERFTYVTSLLLLQTLVSYLYTVATEPRGEGAGKADQTPTLYYCCIALTYLLAMASSTTALQWVSYPAQVVAKAGKPIPVLVMGVLVGHKVFPLRKYLFVLMIVAGVVAFMYRGDRAGADTSGGAGVGELLLLCSLAMDGVTNALQERIMFHYAPSSNRMMMKISQFSVLYLGAAALLSGELLLFLSFLQRYPHVCLQVLGVCLAGTLGSYFIYQTITEFGTLTCSLITTTRKFFSVLGSIIIFGNSLSPTQWLAVVCIFSGLFLDAYYGKSPKRPK